MCDLRHESGETWCATCGARWDYGDFDRCKRQHDEPSTEELGIELWPGRGLVWIGAAAACWGLLSAAIACAVGFTPSQ
jgi:hypothetical protein